MDRKGRHRIQHSISDIVLIELWLACELDASQDEISDAFARIQARMLVVQSILFADVVPEQYSPTDPAYMPPSDEGST